METITIILSIFAGTGIWTFLSELIKEKRKRKTPLEQGVLALLHKELFDLCEIAILRGEITIQDLDTITEVYTPYKKLGGNGMGTELYDEVTKLPKVKNYTKY